MKNKKTQIFRKIDQLMSLQQVAQKDGRNIQEIDLSLLKNAAMVVEDQKIIWLGSDKNIPKHYASKRATEEILKGYTVLPGFVECHTHSLFAGSRANEFEQRLSGVTYQEIAANGGGILSTVKATRSASPTQLKLQTQARVDRFFQQGVTHLEVKTGYALDLKNELKCLRIINDLKGPKITSTFLGAHAVAPEFKTAKEYLSEIETWLPKVRKLTSRLDIWIEKNYFEASFAKAFLSKAKAFGFELVVHADQLTLSGGTEVAVQLGALSADHVIQLKEKEIQKIARSQTTAVLLPAADLYMMCDYPPARKLISEGARVALATDFNPGSCPTQDLALIGLLARLEMKMTLPEVISAYTYAAAAALGKQKVSGSLEVGKYADFVCIDEDWTHLFYQAGQMPVRKIALNGDLNLTQAQ